MEAAVPTPVPEDTTNVGGILVDRSRLRAILRWFTISLIAMLVVGDVWLYSLLQREKARVEMLTHRIDRLEVIVVDALTTTQNAVRIESLGQKVEGMSDTVSELKATLNEDNPALAQ